MNTGSVLNIIPLSTLDAVRMPLDRIVKQLIKVLGFEGTSLSSIVNINLELIVGPIRTIKKFHVTNGSYPSYNVLPGRP